jgi:transcriptional regulator with XRE-family HTH domain
MHFVYTETMLIKQKEIAAKAHVSHQMLSNILTGRRRPSWSTAKKIAEATGSDPVDWMESPPETLRIIIQRMYETQAQGINNGVQ